jgi:cell division protein FtsB
MTLHTISVQTVSTLRNLGARAHRRLLERPLAAALLLLCAGVVIGGGLNATGVTRLQREVASQEQALDSTRRDAQRAPRAWANCWRRPTASMPWAIA